ncbi:MAG: hypothetical protein ABIQ27_04255 [Flavobacterium sp.]|uniref:hypothetical protein n=1 Tax=Flavobacterium sp. TaxID=239 RepID=UPI00326383DD
MIKILKAIVTKLGGVDVSEKNHVDTFTENKMIAARGTQIASSKSGGIWIEYQELAGFKFLNAIIIGQSNMKTMNGCELTFLGENMEIKLNSDTQEIESDFSNVSNRWLTSVTFDITTIETDFIENKTADTIQLSYKKSTEIFNVLK